MSTSETILERVASLADEWKLANLQPQIGACRNLLHTRDGIDVAVFGRFKAGKSSFLNHLAGRGVLPIGVVPLTAVITRLRYGERDLTEVCFLNSTTKNILLEEIGRYVGENENPNNEKQVAAVEIQLPELKPLAPLQFVDTPGLDSTFAHNTKVALNWLPNVGAALVAVSSDAPLSERDLALLEELRRHTPKIVLLLTKADLLTEPQRIEVLNFVRQQLHHKWGGELPVFFYSIHPALSDLKTKLRDELLIPLLRNRIEIGGQILRHKLASLVHQTLAYLRLALAAATQSESARAALREKLAGERRQFDLLRAELNVLAREWSASALDGYLAELLSIQQALQRKITTELHAQFPHWKLRLPSLLVAWREWLDVFLKRELAEVSRTQAAMFCEPLHKARAHLTRTLDAFHARLAGQVKAALDVSLAPGEFALEVREPSAPPVDVAFAFDAAFTTIGWLVPLTLFRRPIERVLRRKARYEVEKNLSRLAADWRDRVVVGINELIHLAEQQAQDDLATLEQTLTQAPSSAPRLRQIIADLESGAFPATMAE
jgi:GTP-binding protein EngB required for normal cell division